MAIIVIAYHTHVIDGETVRIYDDSTEKYFDSIENPDAKKYIEYLATNKGYAVDSTNINILEEGDFDVDDLYKADALGKLNDEEKRVLGL